MTKRRLADLTLGVVFLPLIGFALGSGEQADSIRTQGLPAFETKLPSEAVVLSVHRQCDYSNDGTTFTKLKAGHVFNQGAIVRTGNDALIDLFFKRIGTTVRLQSDTEVMLEKMTRRIQYGAPVMETLLDLRKGRIFTVVRVLVPGSRFEIRNMAGRSVVEGGGMGRYIITADGTQVADKSSLSPLKLVSDTGITVISPGQQFTAKEGKMLPVATPEAVRMLIDFDELQSLADELTAPTIPEKLTKLENSSEALVLSIDGNSKYSEDALDYKKLKVGQVLKQGAIIRTGDNTMVDLFLRRLGTTVRMASNTELNLEKMTRTMKGQVPILETLLDLKKGRIFCFVRLPIAESKFEVRTAVGRSVLNGTGTGRYDIRADGTVVAGKSSLNPLKVFTEHGVTLVVPGQKFSAKNGDLMPIAPSDLELLVIQLDELQSLTERLWPEDLEK